MATQKRILIWAVSRSLSTVLVRALSQIPDSLIIVEYLMGAGANELTDDQIKDFKMSVDSTVSYQSSKKLYEDPHPGKSFIVGKEMADSIKGRLDMIPEGYTHVFLMRHPAKAITSLDNALSFLPPQQRKMSVEPRQFKSLFDVYEYATKTLGQETAVVLDADDLLANPVQTLRLFCESTGLPFSQDLLHWDQLKDEMPSNWLMPKFMWEHGRKTVFRSAFESTGFHTNQRSGAAKKMESIQPEIQELIHDALPYYECLLQHRLIVQ